MAGMNSPYMGKFVVSQQFILNVHDGLDIYGIDSKEIHSTVNGIVHYAGWENIHNDKQGFGQYVCIRFTYNNETWYAYFGHLSKILVKTGQTVKITDTIGIEGTTGHSTGNHCHYEIRKGFYKGATVMNVSTFSGIPNALGTYDDGYRPKQTTATTTTTTAPVAPVAAAITFVTNVQNILNRKGAKLEVDGKIGNLTLTDLREYTIEPNDSGELTKWTQERLKALGYDVDINGVADTKMMNAIHKFQRDNGLGEGILAGGDWAVLLKK